MTLIILVKLYVHRFNKQCMTNYGKIIMNIWRKKCLKQRANQTRR